MQTHRLLVGIACLCATFYAASIEGASRDSELSDRLEARLPGFFGPQTAPSAASAVERLVTDGDPTAAFVISFPVGTVLKSPRDFAFYYSLLEVATPYVDVVVLLGSREFTYTGLLLRRLEEAGLSEEALARIHFVANQSNEFWVGDYGPRFAKGGGGELLLLDAIYRPLGLDEDAMEADAFESGKADLAGDQKMLSEFRLQKRRSDVSPLFISKFVRQHYQFDCEVVRPPLHLKGGNFIVNSGDHAIVSESTILANGGRIHELGEVFKLYYGVSKTVVLDALPNGGGSTLSSLLQAPAENVIVLSDAPSVSKRSSASQKRRRLVLSEIVEANLAKLQNGFPTARIYRVPMPPIVSQDSAKVARTARAQVFARVCEEIGVDYARYSFLPSGDPQREKVQEMVAKRLESRFGKRLEVTSPSQLSAVFEHYLDLSWQDLLLKYDGEGTVYRSYTSGLQIGRQGQGSVWLLPRYRARAGENAEDFVEMEKEVERVYREIDPEGLIYWLEADVLAERHGSLSRAVGVIPWH